MNPHQPTRPLDAWTEVLEDDIAAGGLQAARDLQIGDTIVDLILESDDGPARATWRHQPRQVAQHIPAGTELYVGEDGRVYGVGLEPPAEPVTVAGVPVVASDDVPLGVLQLRHRDGRVLSQHRLETIAGDEPIQDYVQAMILTAGAVPHLHPADAEPGAPERLEQQLAGHQGDAAIVDEAIDRALREGILRGLGSSDLAKVYVASSWRNPLQPTVVRELEAIGLEVYDFRNPPGRTGFAWSSIDPDWQDWTAEQYLAALDHPLADAGFASDFDAMHDADTFVLVLPCGRSAHLELGWAVGQGKRTVILTQDGEEPELMAKMVDHIATSLDGLLEWLQAERVAADATEADRVVALDRILAAIDDVPVPYVTQRWDAPDLAAVEAIAGVQALEEVAVAATVDVDVAVVEQLRDAAGVLRAHDTGGPLVIRAAIATGLEHAARTLEAGETVDDLDEVVEIAQALADAATLTDNIADRS